MKDKLDINLRIGSVNLNLTIRPEEEQLLREAAREVNHAYEEYLKRYAGSSPQEVLAKVTLLFARGYLTTAQQVKSLKPMLDDFEAELDRLLQ